MMLQNVIVIAIIIAAIIYAVVSIVRKHRSFTVKHGCGSDCGCSGGSKKLTS